MKNIDQDLPMTAETYFDFKMITQNLGTSSVNIGFSDLARDIVGENSTRRIQIEGSSS